jgi:hypothetical protein
VAAVAGFAVAGVVGELLNKLVIDPSRLPTPLVVVVDFAPAPAATVLELPATALYITTATITASNTNPHIQYELLFPASAAMIYFFY